MSAGVRKRLEEAQATQTPVRVRRAIRRADVLDGFVSAVGARWLLLAVVDESYLDGYAAVRLDDVTRVDVDEGTFTVRALRARGQWPVPLVDDAPLDRTAALLAFLGERWPLVTINVEEDDPTVCFIGEVARVTTRTLHLLEVSTEAEWDDEPTPWPLRDVTRVDVGGRYEQALWDLAGPARRSP